MSEIENSELFKYSPYKSLNTDQYNSIIAILKNLTANNASRIFISGSAGTGKTILAAYLIKLLNTSMTNNIEQQLREEGKVQVIAANSKDHKEGIKAFLEKRKPVFTGE